ncbi:hypothetical protein OHS81_14950 [Streptomyces sp. NBC_00400]|uniref:hypothetical protein n=1 Tax=Streptomyces sp. NBC_00400 TaxID=2975737 RepID=UPI002E227A4D
MTVVRSSTSPGTPRTTSSTAPNCSGSHTVHGGRRRPHGRTAARASTAPAADIAVISPSYARSTHTGAATCRPIADR